MSKPLSNYLRMYRKRTGLSEEEVAYLLGVEGGSNVGRHELRRRTPTLQRSLAYEVIYGEPAKKLFQGEYLNVEGEISRRARFLRARIAGKPKTRTTERRLRQLERIIQSAS